jgi:hypothetical protein
MIDDGLQFDYLIEKNKVNNKFFIKLIKALLDFRSDLGNFRSILL